MSVIMYVLITHHHTEQRNFLLAPACIWAPTKRMQPHWPATIHQWKKLCPNQTRTQPKLPPFSAKERKLKIILSDCVSCLDFLIMGQPASQPADRTLSCNAFGRC